MFVVFISIVILLIDQLSKYVIFRNFAAGVSFSLIRDVLSIKPIYNSGAAFSILEGRNSLLAVLSILIIVALCILCVRIRKKPSKLFNVAVALLIAGALGNVIDRLCYAGVRDFLTFNLWPLTIFGIFNMADIAISASAVLLIIKAFSPR